MDNQNLTEEKAIQFSSRHFLENELLKAQQMKFVDFLAIGGLLTLESDNKASPYEIKQMTITEFCDKIGISRDTFYRWKNTIPGLGDLVRDRRKELWSSSRETAVFNRLYLIGMTGKGQPAVTALTALAGHFSKLETPVQRSEIKDEGQSWADLVEKKTRNAIEAEIVSDPNLEAYNAPSDNPGSV